jgi:hypothetical protein
MASQGSRRFVRRWAAWLVGAVVAGWALVAVLAALVPAAIVIRVGEPGGLVPPMLSGVHEAERNYGHPIRWTDGRARLRWPGRFAAHPAAVVVTVAGFPGRQADQVEIRVNGVVARHLLSADYADLRVALPDRVRAPLDIAITTPTTLRPEDGRALGVRLEAVTIETRPLADRLGRIEGTAGILLLGGLAWLIGGWAAGAGASRTRRWRSALLAWGVVAVLAAVLAPTALRNDTWTMLLPVLLGLWTVRVLARAGQTSVVAAACGAVIALQGLVITTWCVSSFVDVPRWDIWDFVELLRTREERGLTLADVWAPHNEHRPSVIRVVLLANVLVSRWNHWNELWAMLAITAVHALVLIQCVARAGRSPVVATIACVAGIGALLATATQWENWLQGWQIALMVGACAISASLAWLTGGRLTWPRVLVAAACTAVACASFASCLLGWPIGALAIVVRRPDRVLAKTAVWLVVGAVVSVAYVHGLARPESLPPPAPVLTSLSALADVTYGTLLALGLPLWYAPLAFFHRETWDLWVMPAIGATGIGMALALLYGHVRDRQSRRDQHWLFPALLIAFSLGASAMTAVGRVPLGLHAMTASRYIVYTVLFWIGLLMLLTARTPWRSRAGRAACLTVATLIVCAGLRAWGDALPFMEQHHVTGVLGREALLRHDWPKTLAIFPVPPVLDQRRQWLERHGLSIYRADRR